MEKNNTIIIEATAHNLIEELYYIIKGRKK